MPAKPNNLREFGNELGLDLSALSVPTTLTNVPFVYNAKTDYGAVGNGIADDTSAIQSAINAASSAGGGVVYLPAGTYRVATVLSGKNKVKIIGDGSDNTTILHDDVSGIMLTYSGPTGTLFTVTANALQNTRRLTFASTTGLTRGDWVSVYDNFQYSGGAFNTTFITRIRSVDSATQITLEEALPMDIHTGGTGGPGGGASTANIEVANGWWTGVEVHGITFRCNVAGGSQNRAVNRIQTMQLQRTINCMVFDCRFDNGGSNGIVNIYDSRSTQFQNCFFDHALDVTGSIVTGATASYTYRSTGQMVQGCFFQRCASIWTFSNSAYVNFNGNECGGAWVQPKTTTSGAQTLPTGTLTVHDTADFPSSGTLQVLGNQTVTYTGKTGTTFTGCSGGTGAVGDNSNVILFPLVSTITDNGGRGPKFTICPRGNVSGNTIHDVGYYGIYMDGSSHSSITGNVVANVIDQEAGGGNGIVMQDNDISPNTSVAADCVISGNRILNCTGKGIFTNGTGRTLIGNNRIRDVAQGVGNFGAGIGIWSSGNLVVGNQIENYPNGLAGIHFFAGARGNPTDNTVTGNRVRNGGGLAAINNANSGGNDTITGNDTRGEVNNFLAGTIGPTITGTGTIGAAGTSIAVTHNLGGTPTRVIITPTTDSGNAIRVWVSAKSSTTFTVTCAPATTNALTFDWQAAMGDAVL